MKNFIYIIIWGIIILMTQSCTTYTTFTVYGEPGTEIMTPNKNKLATISGKGTTKIKNNNNNFYSFLISHQPGSNDYIPFALDYKNKKYRKWWATTYTGLASFVAGAAIYSGDNDLGSMAMSAGLLIGAIGGYGLVFSESTTNRTYHYKYLPTQNTNQDLKITKPNLVPMKITTNAATSVTNGQSSSVSTKKIGSSISTKNLKDNAAKLEGTYVGTGNLKSGKDIVEDYTGIQVVITKKTKDIVLVNVYESDGSKFFASDGEYTIQKLSNGKYSLALNGIKNATIEIDTQNNLIYLHPRVNIDNEIYTLSIKAKKN